MPQITQKFGFQAKAAITSIEKTAAALASLNRQLVKFNAVSDKADGNKLRDSFREAAAAAKKAGKSTKKFNDGTAKLGDEAPKSIQKVTFAMEGLVKALAARFAVQALTRLISALSDAAEEAATLQIEIAKISNIAKGTGSSIDGLTDSVKDLSVSLGRDIGEVTEAAFEALQNDLGSTAETMDLLANSANDLALVTGGSLPQAVNSISSVLKAYDLDISKAAEVSDVFFASVDAGRITLQEYESTLGSVLPFTASLGVAWEEAAAGIAAITRQGVTGSRAMTQLRNVTQKLLKPTDAMKDAFRELGVASGTELVKQTGGLIEALNALKSVADPSTEQFQRMFGSLRASAGAMNLLKNNSKDAAQVLRDVENSANRVAEGADNIDATSARELQKATQKLNETFRELGDSIVDMQLAGTKAFNDLIPDGEELGNTMKILTGAMAAGGVAALTLGIGITAAFAPFLIAGAAVVAVNALMNAFIETADEAQAAGDAMREALIERSKDRSADRLKEINNAAGEVADSLIDMSKAATLSFLKISKGATIASTAIKASFKDGIEGFLSGIDGIVGEIQNKIDGIDAAAKSFEDRAKSFDAKLQTAVSEAALSGLTKQQRATERLSIANKELQKAKELAAKVTSDPATQKAFLDQQKKAAQAVAQAKKDAANTDNAFNIRQAEGLELESLATLRDANLDAADALHSEKEKFIGSEEQKTIQALENIKRIAEGIELFPNGKSNLDEVAVKLEQAFKDLDPSLLDHLGESEALIDLVNDFQKKMSTTQIEWKSAAASLQTALDAHDFSALVKLQIQGNSGNEELDKKLKSSSETLNASQGLKAGNKAANEFLVTQEKARASIVQLRQKSLGLEQSIALTSKRIIAEMGRIEQATLTAELTVARQGVSWDGLQATFDSFSVSKVDTALKGLTESALGATKATEASVNSQISSATDLVETLAREGELNAAQVKISLKAIENAKALLDVTLQKNKQEEIIDPAAVENIKAQMQAAKLSLEQSGAASLEIKDGLKQSSDQAGVTATSVSGIQTAMSGVTGSTNAAVTAMGRLQAAAVAALKASSAASSAGGSFAYTGGKVNYRANGGALTRGQDTQLTALSAGEMVINRKSTGRFFSQLQSINSGQAPQYREKGGTVNQFGDINVNVSDKNGSPEQTGRSIASELARDIRRRGKSF